MVMGLDLQQDIFYLIQSSNMDIADLAPNSNKIITFLLK